VITVNPLKDLKRIVQSFKFAFDGITYVLSTQNNMRIHVIVAFIALILSIILDVPQYQLLLVFFSIVFVMCMELINTAIEKTIDLMTTEYHPLAKIAKDVAAGAVLFAAIFAFIIGVYVFTHPMLALFSYKLTFPLERVMLVVVFSILLLLWLKKGRG
jgi:diacylglycerol kinase (ATP)